MFLLLGKKTANLLFFKRKGVLRKISKDRIAILSVILQLLQNCRNKNKISSIHVVCGVQQRKEKTRPSVKF